MSNTWHYLQQGKEFGPISEEELQRLVTDKTISPLTLIWSSSHENWKPFKEVFPDTYFSLQKVSLQKDRPLHPAEKVALLPFPWDLQHCNIKAFAIALGITIGLPALLIALAFADRYAGASSLPGFEFVYDSILGISTLVTLITISSILVVIVLMLKFLYRAWYLLGPFNPSTTPGKAVGLLFIPIVSPFWTKRVFSDWSTEYLALVQSRQELVNAPRIYPKLFTAIPLFAIGHLFFSFITTVSSTTSTTGVIQTLSGITGALNLLFLISTTFACLQMAQVVNYIVSCRKEAHQFQQLSSES